MDCLKEAKSTIEFIKSEGDIRTIGIDPKRLVAFCEHIIQLERDRENLWEVNEYLHAKIEALERGSEDLQEMIKGLQAPMKASTLDMNEVENCQCEFCVRHRMKKFVVDLSGKRVEWR